MGVWLFATGAEGSAGEQRDNGPDKTDTFPHHRRADSVHHVPPEPRTSAHTRRYQAPLTEPLRPHPRSFATLAAVSCHPGIMVEDR